MSHAHEDARRGRPPNERERRVSATTAEGLAAERTALADRDRERGTSRARVAARRLQDARRLEDPSGRPVRRHL
jgi:hypothetical protein